MKADSKWWRNRAKATTEQPSASLLTFLQSKEGERAVLNVLANNAARVRSLAAK